MKIESKKHGYVLVGFLLGLAFPIVAILAELAYGNLSLSTDNIALLFARGPLEWIILSAPFVLGVVFYIFEKMVIHQQVKWLEDNRRSTDQLSRLESFIVDIERDELSNKDYDFENKQLTSLLSSLKGKLLRQKEEDEKAKWVAEGHAKFGEILRMSTDLMVLSEEVVRNLVRYTNSNQGSVFIHENGANQEEGLALTACYAFDRKKHVTKIIQPGQGLVGQCYLENETIVLTTVPKDYIKINSGLGEATPGCLVIVPIKANGFTEGVLELAGFEVLGDYQIKFIEKVCEGFASVVRTVNVASETRRLLEESKHQTEQLQAREEEISQNMEEMHATQEQLTRQLDESKTFKDRVERRERVMALTTILSETDLKGTILFVNDKFCEISKYKREELIGKPQNIVRHLDMPKELFKLFWSTIQRGEVFTGIIKNRAKDGTPYWVEATIVPIKNEKGEIWKYVGSRYHIKDEGLATSLYNKQAKQFNWPRL